MGEADKRDISEVVRNRWCTGCGTCVAFCPANALEIEYTSDGRYVPALDEGTCTNCGLCMELCPAANENFKELNEFVFDKVPNDVLLGNFINCYTGYSTDSDVRFRATSGGMITSLLLFLLREKMIDGAVLTRLKKNEPLKAEPFIARSEEDVISGMGSKYVPVPLNTILDKVMSEEGKFAVVGLPCHLHGIRRAEMKIPKLREKIIYHFGLTCSRTISFLGVDFVLRRMGITPGEIVELKYRGDGWPGGLRALLKDTSEKFVPNMSSWWSEVFGGLFFSHYYCTLCSDHFSELADISFADAWLKNILRNDEIGTSIAVTRSARGQELVENAVSCGAIETSFLSAEATVQSQLFMTMYKKRNIRARVRMLKLLGRLIPPNLERNPKAFLKPTIWDYVVMSVPYLNISISRNRFFRTILRHMPLYGLMFCRKVFKFLLVRNTKYLTERNDG